MKIFMRAESHLWVSSGIGKILRIGVCGCWFLSYSEENLVLIFLNGRQHHNFYMGI